MQEIEDYEAEAKARMKWISYKEHKILLDDYSNIMPEQLPPLIERKTNLTFQSGKKSKFLLKKTAVVGITGVKKIFLNIVDRFTGLNAKAVSSMEEAKEWLVK